MQTSGHPIITQSPVLDDGALVYVPVESIHVKEGFNPRRFFEPKALNDLVESVQQQGILQPLVLRERTPAEGEGYWLIAGERRLRAAKKAGLDEVPAVVRHVNEAQALSMSVAENLARDDMSLAEEARVAQRALTQVEGDRAEAARLLGWSPSTLDSRLALLNCAESVLDALEQRTIRLGHAELLSTLPATLQDGTLPTIIERSISVADLKKRIAGIAQSLSAAIFDKIDCAACKHNSSAQGVLFAEHIEEGQCANRECFGVKTQAVLVARKAELEARYNQVWLDHEREPSTYRVALEADVGADQFAACQQCKHFGVLISSQAGNEGHQVGDVCFDPPCFEVKHKAHTSPTRITSGTKSASKNAAPSKNTSPKPNASEASATASPKKVQAAIDGQLRRVAAALVSEQPAISRAVRLYALVTDAGSPSKILSQYHLPVTGRSECIAALIKLEAEQCHALEAALIDCILLTRTGGFSADSLNDPYVQAAKAVIAATNTDLSARVTLDESLLDAHTKAGMAGLLKEARYDAWLNKQEANDAAFTKLVQRPVKEIIKKVLNGEYDFSRFVPAIIEKDIKTMSERLRIE